MLVSIIGTMGVGKSTILDYFSRTEDTKIKLFYEPLPETDNFILEHFYKEPKKWAFTMQALMLGLHLDIQRTALEFSDSGYLSVMDSSLYCGMAYVDTQYQNGVINDIEYQAYKKLYTISSSVIRKPDIIFMLDTSSEEIISRVRKRNRACEQGVDVSYLKTLHSNYRRLVESMQSEFNVVYIDSSRDSESVYRDILRRISDSE